MSEPCYTGGPEALINNANALEALLGADKFSKIRDVVNGITKNLEEELPTLTEDNLREVFATMRAREAATGGNPEIYKSALQNITLKNPDGTRADDVFEAIRSVMLHQHVYTQGMQVSTNKMIGLAERITNAKSKGLTAKEVEGLEVQFISAQAQLRNYMAHRSSIGSGLSFAFSQRRKSNVVNATEALDGYVESFTKNYKDAFEGEEFLQGVERNSKTKEILESQIKDLAEDADISPHVQAAKDAVTETQADLDNYLKTREAVEEGATGKAGAKKKKKTEVDQTEVDLQAKVKAANEDVTQLTRLKDLQDKVKVEEMDASAIQAEIDSLKPAKGKSLSNLNKRLTKLKKEKASPEEIEDLTNQIKEVKTATGRRNTLQKRLANLKNSDKEISKVEADIKKLQGKVDKIKELNQLEKTLAALKKPKSDIKKTKEQIEKIKKAREEEARRRIEASEITTEAQYKKFINQTLGARDAKTLAKRLTFADKMGKAEESVRHAANMSEKTGFHKTLDMGLQWFTGSLLSGPPTFVLNAVTPILSRTLQQLELATGALMTGNMPLFKASLDMHNLFYGTRDAFKMGNASLQMDKDALLGGQRMFDEGDDFGAFASANFKNVFLSNEPMSKVMDTINFLTRLPNRINGSVDSFNKTMATMKYLRTHFTADAIAKKIPHGEVEEYVRKNVQKMFNKDGSLYSEARMMKAAVKQANDEGLSRSSDEATIKFQQRVAEIIEGRLKDLGPDKTNADTLSRTAEKFARESTFTDEPGKFTQLIKQGLNQMPVFKFIMPFVSTPMNILHFGWRRTLPGAMLDGMIPVLKKTKDARTKEWAELTPMEQAASRGRYATAVASTGAMIYFASQHGDRITGGGPRNRQERKALMATGWQPYSFVMKGEDGSKTYVSYERVDPLATMIGLIADAAEFTKMNPDDNESFAELFSALSFTVAENMTDKSFLRGINNILNITQEPDIYIPKTFKDITSAMAVPMFIDKIKNVDGEQMIRESRTLGDAILRKLPVAEERVPPKRTFLGEAVYKQNPLGVLGMMNPIYIKTTKNDLVDEKIQGLLYGFSMPQHNWTKGKETDMREFYNADGRQAYDRMLELTGEHKIYDRTLRQSLKALFKSPAYKQAEQNFQQFGGGEGDTDPRVRLAKRIITRYRSVAKRLVIQEFPELQQTVKQVQQRNYQLRTGQSLNPIPSL
jgi:hypothetical protein